MLSWATESLIEDGAGESDIRQGVTLEVMGEGNSMGPYNEDMVRLETERQGDIKYPIDWRTLGQYFAKMERRGIAPNIASFVGATTVRDPPPRRRRCRPDAGAAARPCRTMSASP